MCQPPGAHMEDWAFLRLSLIEDCPDGAPSFCEELNKSDDSAPSFPSLNIGDLTEYMPSYEACTLSDFDSPFFSPLIARSPLDNPFSLDQIEGEKEKIQGDEEPLAQLKHPQSEGERGEIDPVQMSLKVVCRKESPLETGLDFHKDYLIERLTNSLPRGIKGAALFQEIVSRGYQGSFRTMQAFLKRLRSRGSVPEAYLEFHKAYLFEKIEDNRRGAVTGAALFREIQKKGYQGSLRNVQAFLSKIRQESGDHPISSGKLSPHEDYLIERLKKAIPVSVASLFKEIQMRGYRGSLRTVQLFTQKISEQGGVSFLPPENNLRFHKRYLVKRLEETHPRRLSGTTLFEEIKMRGYRGSLKTLQTFLTTARRIPFKDPPPVEAHLCFHRHYLLKRIEETRLHPIPVSALFKEIQKKGYVGSVKNVQNFLKNVGYEKPLSEKDVRFHASYLIKRFEEAPHPLQISQLALKLFREIKSKGYRGTLKTVEVFIKKIRRRGRAHSRKLLPEASLHFHKDYLNKRLKEAHPRVLSGKELFVDIRSKGYQGTLKNVQSFVAMMRKSEYPPESYLDFHKPYLIEKMQASYPRRISPSLLLREIRARGYKGLSRPVYAFLSAAREVTTEHRSNAPLQKQMPSDKIA